ncbi:MAG: methyltransferase domain-containing protein [Gammaproteobacteria bacterium]|nr:MAG: methyltransferase domain-containing protein [Gammaproteobacteria bacterium]
MTTDKQTQKSGWNVNQYEKFKNERTQPFIDLLTLVQPKNDMRILDLGCGTGELTKMAHERLKARETVGIDSSESMLAKSKQFESDSLHFLQSDINRFAIEGPFDLILSNAALQWIPEHEKLFSFLTSLLSEHGQLAIQMPANHDQPAHQIAFEMAEQSPFKEELKDFRFLTSMLPIEKYAILLYKLGFCEQDVYQKAYPHVLATRDEVTEWVKGSLLTVYKERLSNETYAKFLVQYKMEIAARIPNEAPLFYPFKRTFVWGRL